MKNVLVDQLNELLKKRSFSFNIKRETTTSIIGELCDLKTKKTTDLKLLKTHLYSVIKSNNLKSFSDLLISNHELNIKLFENKES